MLGNSYSTRYILDASKVGRVSRVTLTRSQSTHEIFRHEGFSVTRGGDVGGDGKM